MTTSTQISVYQRGLVTAARIAIAATVTALVLLASLRVLSPEFDPAWRAVSEYANGNYGWMLSLMFACWALGTWALAYALHPLLRTPAGKIGLCCLIAAGVGEAMAVVFDINQPLHGLAGLLGVGALPVAAVLVGSSLRQTAPWLRANKLFLWSTHATWIALILMIAALMLEFITFTHAGGRIPDDGSSLPVGTTLPHGTIALFGYANRLLIVVYCVWAIVTAREVS